MATLYHGPAGEQSSGKGYRLINNPFEPLENMPHRSVSLEQYSDPQHKHLIVGGVTEHVLWVVLTILYSSLCLLVVVQLGRIIVYRHNVVSFQGGFLLLCCLWSTLRLLFWFSNTFAWHEWVQLLCYWLPNLLQFAMFADLVVYYLKIIHVREWDRLKCRVWSLYIAANVLVGSALLVWIWLFQVVYKNKPNKETIIADYYSIFSGITFGILMIFISYYGYRVFKIRLTRRMRLYHPFASTTVMVGLTFLVFIVFLTRCVYGLLLAWGGHAMRDPVGSRREQWKTLPQAVDVATFVLLILWELLPTFALVMLFRRIPRTKNNLCAMCFDAYFTGGKGSRIEDGLTAQSALLDNAARPINYGNTFEAQQSSSDSNEVLEEGIAKPSPGRKLSGSALIGGATIFENANRYDSDGDNSPYGYGSISVTPGTPLFLNNVLGASMHSSLGDRAGSSGTGSMEEKLNSHTSPYDLLHAVSRAKK